MSELGGRGPITQEGGGTGGTIPVGGPPRPRPIFQILALIAAIAGVIAGLLGYCGVLLFFCGLSAVFNLISLVMRSQQGGGTGGTIPVDPPRG